MPCREAGCCKRGDKNPLILILWQIYNTIETNKDESASSSSKPTTPNPLKPFQLTTQIRQVIYKDDFTSSDLEDGNNLLFVWKGGNYFLLHLISFQAIFLELNYLHFSWLPKTKAKKILKIAWRVLLKKYIESIKAILHDTVHDTTKKKTEEDIFKTSHFNDPWNIINFLMI